MRYVCDAPDTGAWFRIERQGEAALESQAMSHAVEKHSRKHKSVLRRPMCRPQGRSSSETSD